MKAGWLEGVDASIHTTWRKETYQLFINVAAFLGEKKILQLFERAGVEYKIDYKRVMYRAARGGNCDVMLHIYCKEEFKQREDLSYVMSQIIGMSGRSGNTRAIWLAILWKSRLDCSKKHLGVSKEHLDNSNVRKSSFIRAAAGGAARGGHKRLMTRLRNLVVQDFESRKQLKAPPHHSEVWSFYNGLVEDAAYGGDCSMLRLTRKWFEETLKMQLGSNQAQNALRCAAANGKVECMHLAIKWGAREFYGPGYEAIRNHHNAVGTLTALRNIVIANGENVVPYAEKWLLYALANNAPHLIGMLYEWTQGALTYHNVDHLQLVYTKKGYHGCVHELNTAFAKCSAKQ